MRYLKLLSLLFLPLVFGTSLQAQDQPEGPLYYKVIKLNDPNGNLLETHRQIMAPYFQERVNRGEMVWQGMYRVMYPSSQQAGYEFISVAIHQDFNNLELNNREEVIQAALPDASPAKMWARVQAESDVHQAEVYTMVDQLFPLGQSASNTPSSYIKVNTMDVAAGKEDAYLRMESDLWKPVHAAQAKQGALENWQLFNRIMPGGTDFGPSYVTVDAFLNWGQINKNGQNMMAAASSVYPGEDVEKKLGKITELRTGTRTETWELVSYTVPATTEKEVIKVVDKGTGAPPMRGQQVAFNVNVTNKDGKLLFDNQQLLGIPMQMVLGSDPFNTFISGYLTKIGTGGKLTVSIPVSVQDMGMRGWSGDKEVTLKYHLLEVGQPASDGVAKLKEIIHAEGLAAAKAWHKKASSEMAEKYAFTEFTMNALGYDLMASGHQEEALYVLAENQRANPKSYNAHDSLADAYHALGNDLKAFKHYEMAVKMNPNATASKQKMAALKK